MMLAEVRRARGLKQEQLAAELGLTSKGTISAIENGLDRPSLELAMRIEVWSGGEVTASELRPDLAELIAAVAAVRTPTEVAA